MRKKIAVLLAFVLILTAACSSNSEEASSTESEAASGETASDDSVSGSSEGTEENAGQASQEVEQLSTIDEITDKQAEIIKKYQALFDEAGVGCEVTPNGAVLYGTDYDYTILDTKYGTSEMVCALYENDENKLITGVNVTFQYFLEKGIDKENPHTILLFECLSDLGVYTSIDDMIADMEANEEKSGSDYIWTNERYGSAGSETYEISFAYYDETACSYDQTVEYCEFDSLDDREKALDDYMEQVEKELESEGLSEGSVAEGRPRDGWENDTYAKDVDNSLGEVVRFDLKVSSQEDAEEAVKIVKVYVDKANELFGQATDVPAELIAEDIVTRGRMAHYEKESNIRLRTEDEWHKVSLTWISMLGKDGNPMTDIQFVQSGCFKDTLGWYSKEEGTIIIEFYIPMMVEGLMNKS